MTAPVLIIFGITGDLSRRKLLPALYHIFSQDLLPPETKIIGVSRRPLDVNKLFDSVELCVLEKDNICNPAGIERLKNAIESFELQPDDPADYVKLRERLEELDEQSQEGKRNRLFYMSIPPDAYAPIVKQLGKNKLNTEHSRLILEKPFGSNQDTATKLVALVDDNFNEDQVYRTDHYLAKDTAQNLLTFRLFNPLFSSLWSAQHIDSVHIRATEEIGIEGRAAFYESTGALRDLIQSHLMQLLALSLMDLPADLTSAQIHRSKQYFLEQLLPVDPATAVRGQYASYTQEVENPASTVETFARIHLKHTAERWQEVDMILETGKAMDAKETSITISFKTPHDHPSNNLRFQIQPNEGILLDLIIKEPGLAGELKHESLKFDYKSAFKHEQHIDAYEKVIIDAINGEQALFASANEVLATWKVLQPLMDAWEKDTTDLVLYRKGTKAENIK